MTDEVIPEVKEEEKHPGGRPTSYDPSFCDKVRELGKIGKSLEQMAMQLDVSYRTLCNWRDTHEEFFHALSDAHAFAQAWWENQAQTYMIEQKDAPRLNSGLWSRSMAARFPKNYSERVKQEITGAEGQPLLTGIEIRFVDPSPTTED